MSGLPHKSRHFSARHMNQRAKASETLLPRGVSWRMVVERKQTYGSTWSFSDACSGRFWTRQDFLRVSPYRPNNRLQPSGGSGRS